MKASSGQTFSTSPVGNPRFQNDLVDMVDWWKRIARGDQSGAFRSPIPTDVIQVKNVTGDDRELGEVLEIGDPVLDDQTREAIWFEADTVSHNGGRSYCILSRPIPDGEIDSASVSGVCIAKVNVIATTDRYAFVENSSQVLKSGPAGQLKLLGPVDATGEHLLAVTFAEYGRLTRFGKADAAIAKGSSGTISLWEYDGSAEADTGINVTAKAYGGAIVSGKIVTLFWGDGRWYVACWEQ